MRLFGDYLVGSLGFVVGLSGGHQSDDRGRGLVYRQGTQSCVSLGKYHMGWGRYLTLSPKGRAPRP
jgi:hypothetical protein